MKRILFSALLLGLVLTGCNDNNEPTNVADKKLPIQVNPMSATVETSRTIINGNKISFANNDKIGLFETAFNGSTAIEWTYSGAAWSSTNPMYWSSKEAGINHNFYAFYPYVATTDVTSVDMPALDAQDGTSATGFMYASKTCDYTTSGTMASVLDINFNHASALIALNIKAKTNAAADFTFTSFSISKDDSNVATKYKYNLKTAEVITIGATPVNSITVTPTSEQTLTTTGNIYYIVVNANTPKGLQFHIEFEKAGVTHTAKGILDLTGDKIGYDAGKKYSYNVSVDLNSINIADATITDWVEVDAGNVDAN